MEKPWFTSWTFWSTFIAAFASVWLVLDPTSSIALGLLGLAIPSTAYGFRKAMK